MTVLEKLQQRRRRDIELPSGLKVSYHLPDVEELIVKVGKLPIGAIAELASPENITEDEALALLQAEPEAAEQGWRYTHLVVASMLDAVDGDELTPEDDREAIVGALEPLDREELFLIGTRAKDPDSGKA